MSLPADFNPATMLYLNPEFQAYSNVITIEQARAYYVASPNSANITYSLSNLPNKFDSKIFIADNKDGLNISGLNKTIKQAMSNDGYTQYDLDVFAQYLPTSYQDLRLIGNNTFAYNDLSYTITDSNLIVGDDIKIVVNNVSFAYGEVISTDKTTNTFAISNFYGNTFSNTGSGDTYLLYGHKIYDFERLGRVNWARNNRSSNPVYGSFSNRFYGLDPDFNVELYQLLYPDSRILTDEQCVLDYTSRRNNNDIRIGKSTEIVSSIAYIFTNLLNLDVDCNLKCDANFILSGYWVNGITSNTTRPSSQASDSNLITERGSKGYLDGFLKGTMELTNVIIDSNATFCNDVQFLAGTQTSGASVFLGDATMESNLNVCMDAYFGHDVSLSNDMVVKNNAVVGNDMTVSSNLLVSNTTTLSNDTTVYGNTYLDGSLTLSGSGDVLGQLYLHSNAFIGCNLSLSNDMMIDNDLTVGGMASFCNHVGFLADTETVGVSTFVGAANMTSNLNVSMDAFFGRDVSVSNDLLVRNDLVIDNDLTVHNGTSLSNGVAVYGDSYLNGGLFLQGSGDVSGRLTLHSDTYLASNLCLSNDLMVGGSANVTNQLFVSSTATFSNDIYIDGDAWFSKSVLIGTDVYIGNAATVSNQFTVLGGTCMTNAYVTGDLVVQSNTTLTNGLFVTGPTTLSNTLYVSDACTISGDLTLSSGMTLLGNACFSNDVSVGGNLTADQSVNVAGLLSVGDSNTYGTLVLDAKGCIRSDEYLLTSDERVKSDIAYVNNEACYDTVRKAPVISYKLRYDPKQRSRYGFLAHEIEQLDDTLVSDLTDFLPNVMKEVVIRKRLVRIKGHCVKKDDVLKVCCKNRYETATVASTTKHSFTLDSDKIRR